MEVTVKVRKAAQAVSSKMKVIDCVRRHGPINRSAIAREVHLSIPSVMSIVEELMARGMLVPAGRATSGVGKHPELLDICGDYFRYIGVDIGRTMVRMVLSGQDGSILAREAIPTVDFQNPRGFVEQICEQMLRMVKSSGIDEETIVGACVAMPGLIEQGTGRVVFSPNFGWEDIPMQEWLNELLPYQTIVENANRAQALWEVRPGSNNENLTVFCIGLAYGVGGALIEKGQLYYGASGTSGEFGHITVCNKNGRRCTCGNTGCVEAMASGAAIAELGQEAVLRGTAPVLQKLCGGQTSTIDAKMVFEAARKGDADADQIIEEAAEYIGQALAISINMLDPDLVLLCGGMMKNEGDFLDRIKKYTKKRQMNFAGRNVVIRCGALDDWHVAKGATLMILQNGAAFEKLSFLY